MQTRKLVRIGALAGAMTVGGGIVALVAPLGLAQAQDAPTTEAPATSEAPATDLAPAAPAPPADGTMPRGPGGPGRHGGRDLEPAATALGLTVDELKTELQAGKSLATIASEKGVDVQTVIDALVAAETAHLDEAVTAGRLTQEEADQRKADLVARVTERVNSTAPLGGPGMGRGRGGHGPGGGGCDGDGAPAADGTTPAPSESAPATEAPSVEQSSVSA